MANPYIASMGVYVFRTEVLMELLNRKYPLSNDFGSEIIPSAVGEYNVQVWSETFSHESENSYIHINFAFSIFLLMNFNQVWSNMLHFVICFYIAFQMQAYLFNDYWEDIGTIKSFFDANLALTEQVFFPSL